MSKRPKKLKMSGGAMHMRAQFQEAKHKRDISGKFADMPDSVVPGAAGGAAATITPAAKADWHAAAKTSQIAGTDKIKLHVASNPKKPGSMSAERFAHYKDGITVAEFKAAGGLPEDLAHDRKKGFITLHEPGTYDKLSTAGASPVAQINHSTATGRLASIKVEHELKAGTTSAAVKPPETTVPAKASGEPPEPPPPPKPVETAPKAAAAAAAKPASASETPKAAETPPTPKNAPTGTPEVAKGTEAQPVVKPVEASGVVRTFKKDQLDQLDDAVLNGVPLKPWTPPKDIKGWQKVEGTMPGLAEPPMTSLGKRGSGVLITEPDGRVWLAKPTNEFGGYKHTFPKGTQEVNEGLSLQANAIKEAYEETGLKVRITGFAGDFKGDTGTARYYHAVREGGTPLDHGWESEAVVLVPKKDLDTFLNKQRDKDIFKQHLAEDAPPPVKTATAGGTAQTGGAPEPPKSNDKRYKFDELTDLAPSKVANESDSGLEWEYKQEYIKYGGDNWVKGKGGDAIKSQADFNQRYKEAPLTYLTDSQYDNLAYTTVNSKRLPTFNEIAPGLKQRNRDPEAIRDRMFNGITTPPIVLKHGNSLRLMAGQSRIWTGLSAGIRVPVKIIDVTPGMAPKPVVPVKLPAFAPPKPTAAGKLNKDDVLSFTAQGKTTHHTVADLRKSLTAKQLQERVDSGFYKRAPAGTAPTVKGGTLFSKYDTPPPPPRKVVKKPGGSFTVADVDWGDTNLGPYFKQHFVDTMNTLPKKFSHALAATGAPRVFSSVATNGMSLDVRTKMASQNFGAYYDVEAQSVHFFQDKGVSERLMVHEFGHQLDYNARRAADGVLSEYPTEYKTKAQRVRERYITNGKGSITNPVYDPNDETYFTTDVEMWAYATENLVMGAGTGSRLHQIMKEEGIHDYVRDHYKKRGEL